MSLQQVTEMCRGFRQFSQRDLIENFSDDFFERIEECVNTKAWSITRYVYMFLQPSMNATEAGLDRFKALKTKLEAYSPEERKEGTMRLLNWVKDSIQDLEEKKQGRELSIAWDLQY